MRQLVCWCNWNWGAIVNIIIIVYMMRVRVSHCRTILCGFFQNYLIFPLQQSEQGTSSLTKVDYFTKTFQNVRDYEAETLFSFSFFYLEQHSAFYLLLCNASVYAKKCPIFCISSLLLACILTTTQRYKPCFLVNC